MRCRLDAAVVNMPHCSGSVGQTSKHSRSWTRWGTGSSSQLLATCLQGCCNTQHLPLSSPLQQVVLEALLSRNGLALILTLLQCTGMVLAVVVQAASPLLPSFSPSCVRPNQHLLFSLRLLPPAPTLSALVLLPRCIACSGHHLVRFGLPHLTNCRLSWPWCKRAHILHQRTPEPFTLQTSRPVGVEPSSWHSISDEH